MKRSELVKRVKGIRKELAATETAYAKKDAEKQAHAEIVELILPKIQGKGPEIKGNRLATRRTLERMGSRNISALDRRHYPEFLTFVNSL